MKFELNFFLILSLALTCLGVGLLANAGEIRSIKGRTTTREIRKETTKTIKERREKRNTRTTQ